MQKDTLIIGTVLVLALVATGGYTYHVNTQLNQANAELAQLREQRDGDEKARADEVTVLRKQLVQEKARYTKLRADYTSDTPSQPAGTVPAVAGGAGTPASSASTAARDFRGQANAWMERLKTEDPERYQRMVQSREERQKAADKALQDQVTSLAQRAQATTNPTEADLITQIATTLDKINQLRQDRAAVANLPEDQQQAKTQEIHDQMQTAFQDLNNLRQQDQTLQMQKLAQSLGLPDSKIPLLVDGVNNIQKNTQYPTGGGGHGGGTGGGRGGP